MKQLSQKDRDLARKIADLLEKQHQGHSSQNKLADDFVYKGYCGEIFFAREFDLPFRFVDRPGGDGGIDFDTRITIDVKTVTLANFKTMKEARSKRHLMVKEGQATADVYVLCGYKPDGRCHLIGWEKRETVAAVPPRVFPVKGGISNHVIKATYLKPMDRLLPLLKPTPYLKEQERVRHQSNEEWLEDYART